MRSIETIIGCDEISGCQEGAVALGIGCEEIGCDEMVIGLFIGSQDIGVGEG